MILHICNTMLNFMCNIALFLYGSFNYLSSLVDLLYPYLRYFILLVSVLTLCHSSCIRTYALSFFFYPNVRTGITGRLIGLNATNNFGRPSVMIFMLCGVLAISFFLYLYDISSNPVNLNFGAFCPN